MVPGPQCRVLAVRYAASATIAAMSRRTLAALAVGWLLGIVTALVTPTLVYQRQSINVRDRAGEAALTRIVMDGWVVMREDQGIFTLERPRFRLH